MALTKQPKKDVEKLKKEIFEKRKKRKRKLDDELLSIGDNEDDNKNMETDSEHEIIEIIEKEKISNTQLENNSNLEKKKSEMFKHSDKGPYNLIVEKTNIEQYEIAVTLKKLNVKGINKINKISNNKLRINFKDYPSANKLLKLKIDDFHDIKEYQIYLPMNYVSTYGIIRNIPKFISLEDIRDNIVSQIPITAIERLNYWNRDLKELQPGTSIKINFRSNNIPEEVKLFYVVNKVELFVTRPLLCQNCLNYGHTKKFCKAEELCKICTSKKHNEDIICKLTCKQCKTNTNFEHRTADYRCPEYKNQQDIKKTMTEKKLTFREAKDHLRKVQGPKHFINPTIMTGPTYAEIIKQPTNTETNNKTKSNEQNTNNQDEDRNQLIKSINAILDKSIETNCDDHVQISINEAIYKYNRSNGAKNYPT